MKNGTLQKIIIFQNNLFYKYTCYTSKYIHTHKGENMLNQPELLVDTIQNAKKQWVEKYIKNIDVKNNLNILLDAQSKFLKTAIQTTSGILSTVGYEMLNTKIEKMFNPYGIDFFKAGWDALTEANRNAYAKKS